MFIHYDPKFCLKSFLSPFVQSNTRTDLIENYHVDLLENYRADIIENCINGDADLEQAQFITWVGSIRPVKDPLFLMDAFTGESVIENFLHD